MAQRNKYLEEFIPHFYQRKAIDIMAFTFIDTYKFVQPTVTLEEAALAFLKRYEISEELFSLNSILLCYHRTIKDYYDAEKKANREKEPRKA